MILPRAAVATGLVLIVAALGLACRDDESPARHLASGSPDAPEAPGDASSSVTPGPAPESPRFATEIWVKSPDRAEHFRWPDGLRSLPLADGHGYKLSGEGDSVTQVYTFYACPGAGVSFVGESHTTGGRFWAPDGDPVEAGAAWLHCDNDAAIETHTVVWVGCVDSSQKPDAIARRIESLGPPPDLPSDTARWFDGDELHTIRRGQAGERRGVAEDGQGVIDFGRTVREAQDLLSRLHELREEFPLVRAVAIPQRIEARPVDPK